LRPTKALIVLQNRALLSALTSSDRFPAITRLRNNYHDPIAALRPDKAAGGQHV
jgi:hypothetical protein